MWATNSWLFELLACVNINYKICLIFLKMWQKTVIHKKKVWKTFLGRGFLIRVGRFTWNTNIFFLGLKNVVCYRKNKAAGTQFLPSPWWLTSGPLFHANRQQTKYYSLLWVSNYSDKFATLTEGMNVNRGRDTLKPKSFVVRRGTIDLLVRWYRR